MQTGVQQAKARRLRSRKDRPCDACRQRKSACIVTTCLPCRYCQSKGQDCTFTSTPSQRARQAASCVKVQRWRTTRAQCSSGKLIEDDEPLQKVGTYEPMSPDMLSCLLEGDPKVELQDGETLDLKDMSFVSPVSLPQTPFPTPDDDISVAQLHSLSQVTYDQGTAKLCVPQTMSNLDGLGGESLDESIGLTALFLGPSSDQDANLLSSMRMNMAIINGAARRSVDANVRQVHAGDIMANVPPVHFNIVPDSCPERDIRTKEIASEKIESHVGEHADALVRLYFRFIHPAFPVLSKARFLQAYCLHRRSIPASLRGVVYGLACAFWEHSPVLKPFPRISHTDLFECAHLALNREFDSPKLATLQACLLLLHESPPVTGTTENPRNWTLACQAISCAQNLGLHCDPSLWNIPTWEKALRKKLWWMCFTTEKWASLTHGNPSHIPQSSFDTTDLTLTEALIDEDVACSPYGRVISERDRGCNQTRAINLLETINLAKKLGILLEYSYPIRGSVLSTSESAVLDHSLYVLNAELDSWYALLPQCLTLDFTHGSGGVCTNGSLHLAYFAVKSLVLRAMMSPATPLSKANPFSNLRTYFDSSLEEFRQYVKLVSSIRAVELDAFWGRQARTHLVHAGNFLIYLFLCASTAEQVEKSYSLLEAYRYSLRALAAAATDNSMGMLRPALLRTESFFREAAGAMRKDEKH
ncbi:hypothetical protein ASPZODRAFT_134391 [Penicilliopsis zonata CBS 506.65]|uniref:Zn(2)-C6 fungal-type domain-containing protein n=1 Tax=Penicilliopsis zonata CBS 506.65 TaxID=1073090 RepID=A0A1L9SCX2_9EURO|nr:hypothetical protein ASPZODRAFT_134391 [Penicilliopsis zonata CBS 506.65]OJJ44973.1 hypothetical protein ASPZODRAFT_134391 [Penicilliopsis zonata CBS 506.65]